MVMMGCGDSDSGSTEEGDDIKVEGDTLVHTSPKLLGKDHFGTQLGTDNPDGSYTFDSTAANYGGGGAQYDFPTPKAGDTWKISDYSLVEITLKTVSGSVAAIVKKGGTTNDLTRYPEGGGQYPTLSADASDGIFTFKTLVSDAGTGIGFQRSSGGPATVKIEKVVFSKMPRLTVTFSGGEYAAMPARPPIEVVSGSTLTMGQLRPIPEWAGHTFTGWKIGEVDFDITAPITQDITLTAQWKDGAPEEVSMALDLDPDNWGELPPHPNTGYTGAAGSAPLNTGGWDHTTEYAAADYNAGVLKLTFSSNRQRAIIPLSDAQIDALLYEEDGVTFRFDATITDDTGATNPTWAGFRCHLADPTTGRDWNGTQTGADQTATLDTHMVEHVAWANAGDGWLNRIRYFAIQAMFRDEDGSVDATQFGFPLLTITINSLSIDLGDTTE